jgi:toxin ParE1/3/4
MRVEYSKRALSDLGRIAEYHRRSDQADLADAVGQRIRATILRIAQSPTSAPLVAQRPGVRVTFVLRYHYKIFYAISRDAVRILHIRHAARRPY